MQQIDGEIYFTLEEVARLLRKTVRTVQRWIYEPDSRPPYAPQLKPIVFPDGRKYFAQQQIQEAYARAIGRPVSGEALTMLLSSAQAVDARTRRSTAQA